MPIISGTHIPILEVDRGAKLVKTSNTIVTLGSLTVTTSISGVNGIDTGAVAASSFYYVYSVVSSGLVKLVASLSATTPTGFSISRKVGAFYTDGSSNIFKAYYYGEDLVDVYSCSFDVTGVTSGENIDWISGNFVVTGTSIFTGTYNANIFSVAPNSIVTPNNNTGGTIIYSWMTTTSNTTVTVKTFQGGVTTAVPCYVICQKQGIDATKPDWSR